MRHACADGIHANRETLRMRIKYESTLLLQTAARWSTLFVWVELQTYIRGKAGSISAARKVDCAVKGCTMVGACAEIETDADTFPCQSEPLSRILRKTRGYLSRG